MGEKGSGSSVSEEVSEAASSSSESSSMGAEGSRSKYQEPVGVAMFRSMARVLRVGQDGGGEG